MDLIYLGKLVNTHGLKGEVKIISDFKYKEIVFKVNNTIYINDNSYKITSYRKHQIYDMITLEGVNDIEAAENLKGFNVYINRNDFIFKGVLDNDIYKGKVVDILKTKKYDLLVIDGIKRHLVPNIDIFIKDIDLKNKKIFINYIEGLDNED